MSTKFDVIKKVDQRTKSIINGFMKEAQSLLPFQDNSYYNIPDLVFMITILYYFNPEYFSVHGRNMELNENKDIMGSHGGRNTVYGNIVITKKDRGKFIWTFKLIEPKENVIMTIGIDSSNKAFVNDRFYCSGYGHVFYGYQSYSEFDTGSLMMRSSEVEKQSWKDTDQGYEYGVIYSDTESQVKMELNMDDKTLKYYVNGKDQGIAFQNICFENDEKYSMCISLDEPMSVRLLDFKHEFTV